MIPIDTRNYVKVHGHEPMGRRYWSFRMVTNTTTVPFRTSSAVTYVAACQEIQIRAEALGAAAIVVDE
jgi:hypothetical protein